VACWLAKTEADAYSIADLERDGTACWDGVRNYQARNFLRAMRRGDQVLVYHSNGDPSGAAGVAKVAKGAYPDPTQFDRRDDHFDPESSPEEPRWSAVDLAFAERFPRVVPLAELRQAPALEGMLLLSGKALRLSVQPLEPGHLRAIRALARRRPGPRSG
jgi:predicted RNA-binding protein with PUA-like domain